MSEKIKLQIRNFRGEKGEIGATPRFTVTAVTGAAGTAASVAQGGTAENPTLEFTIPRGDPGTPGAGGGLTTAPAQAQGKLL